MKNSTNLSFLLFLLFILFGFHVFPVLASGSNLVTDPGLENWTGSNLDSWSTLNGGPGTPTFSKEANLANVHGGSFAVKIVGDTDTSGYIVQTVSGLTSGQTYNVSFWAKGATGSESSSFLILNSDDSQAWNFSGASSGTWTAFTGNPTVNQYTNRSLSASYQLVTNVVTPNSSAIKILVGGGSLETSYFDDVDVSLVTSAPYNGNLPIVGTNQKSKLFLVNSTYYFAFSSSTVSQDSYTYITTSTSGVLGTWSQPHVINSDKNKLNDDGTLVGFDLEYNSSAGFFGLAYNASSTAAIYFSTSTDGFSWSSPVTVFTQSNPIDLGLNGSKSLIAFKNSNGTDHILKTFYSSNFGSTWSAPVTVYTRNVAGAGDPSSDILGSVIGSDGSLHILFFDDGDGSNLFPRQMVYSSSTDSGVSWTSTLVGQEIANDATGINVGSLDLDSNNQPGILYYKVNSLSGSGPFDVGLSSRFAKRAANGNWTTSTISSSITASGVTGLPSNLQLKFIGGSYPLLSYFGNNLYPTEGISTSTSPYNFQVSQLATTVVGNNTSFGLTYDTSNAVAGFSFMDAAGQAYFVTSSLVLPPPTAPSGLVISSISTSTLNISWTDNSDNEDTFTAGYSTDGVTYNYVSKPANTTSITNITGLSPNTQYWFHVASVNSFGTSTFAVTQVYTLAEAPTGLAASAVSASQINLSWDLVSGAASYKVYSNADGYVTAIGTPSGNSYSDTGLSANTTYSYKVSAVNSSGEGTKTSAVSAATQAAPQSSGGGGGSYYVSPYNLSLLINNGATSTTNPVVNLTLGVVGGTEMMLANDPSFVGASWESFKVTKSWILSSDIGAKVVYVKYRDSNGTVSAVASAQIILLALSNPGTPTPSVVASVLPVVNTPNVTSTATIPNIDLEVVNPQSNFIISNVKSLSLQPASNLEFNYTYTNKTENLVRVRLVRQVLNNKGTVVVSTQAFRNIKAGAEVSVDVQQLIGRYWTPGIFTERIRIYDAKGSLLDENSFSFTVEKFKFKYLVRGELGSDNAIAFDQAVWEKNRFDVKLPTVLRVRYSYTNQTEVKQDVRMIRDIVDVLGKVVETRRGRWVMNPQEIDRLTFSQNLSGTLAPGNYTMRVRALDFKTGEVIAENSLTFGVELK